MRIQLFNAKCLTFMRHHCPSFYDVSCFYPFFVMICQRVGRHSFWMITMQVKQWKCSLSRPIISFCTMHKRNLFVSYLLLMKDGSEYITCINSSFGYANQLRNQNDLNKACRQGIQLVFYSDCTINLLVRDCSFKS